MPDTASIDRRDVLVGMGALGASAALPVGSAAAGDVDTSTVDDAFDLSGDDPIEAIVVFDSGDAVSRLTDLDLARGLYEYSVLPMAYTALTPDQIGSVGGWDSVRRVKKAETLEWVNDDSRDVTGVDTVQNELGYDGSTVDAVVIDSGIDGSHPDFEGRVESNWQWVDDPLGTRDADWVDVGVGDTDELGHGQHCSGILAGDGAASDGQYRGMAPGARLSVYSTTQTVYLPYVVGAWDHVLRRADDPDVEFDPDVVSNSYGVARDVRYNPNDPVNVASWAAFQRGILCVFAAGNDGPDADTLSRFAKAPHVLGVGATTDDKSVTDFSSRGRTPDEDRATIYDRWRALRNLRLYEASMTSGQYVVDVGTWTGEVGPAADDSTTGTEASTDSDFHEWYAPPNADVLELTLDISPDGQQVRVSIREGSRDGTIIAQMGEEPVHQHRTLTTDVEGGTTYYVEVEPMVSVVVEYTLDYEGVEKVRADPEQFRPVGLYRPGVGAPGNAVMSTIDPHDALAPTSTDEEPFYAALSGTSMACPAAAGICALVIDAARQNDHGTPHPLAVINTVEATAEDALKSYVPWSVGAGFVDAAAAVRRAEDGDLARFNEVELVDSDTLTLLDVAGSRTDDGDAFTAGQTNEVEVTVGGLSHAATVRDTVPSEWRVIAEYSPDVERVDATGDATEVYFGEVEPADAPVTVSYLVEAPEGTDSTGTYTFGPAAANAPATDEGWVAFGGTDDNAVVGEET
jgi:serine protease AprX